MSKIGMISRRGRRLLLSAAGALLATALTVGAAAAESKSLTFEMVRSSAISAPGVNCLPNASATVKITPLGPVEIMDVDAQGLPPKTEFDFFVTQLPNSPFGVSWYQGDVETNGSGKAHQRFIGRFNIETFAVAPGSGPAPSVHASDASTNPAFAPVHTYHLGLWFNSPKDAQAASCPSSMTPFNGDHNAGVQVLSTRNFDNDHGPLRKLNP